VPPRRARLGHIIITQTSMLSRTGRPPLPRSARRAMILLALGIAPTVLVAPAAQAGAAVPADYVPNEIVVGYTPVRARSSTDSANGPTAVASSTGAGSSQAAEDTQTRVLRLPHGDSVATALRQIRARHGVQWAVPNYTAHAAGDIIPDDEGTNHTPGGWQELQWNFIGQFGVNAPEAWANVAADGRPGGSDVTVAVLDTGVAYSNRGPFRRSPDLSRYTFVKGYDFVAKDPYANDRNGHGTFVASTIAEDTDNHYGLTGLAFAAHIMPVRVLDGAGEGEASTIAEGVMFAVKHHAQIINLSLEFSPGVTAADIPELMKALRYAHRHNVLVVAAAGNEGARSVDYPARAPNVVAVGATTEHGCLADYSNYGPELTLVAPGGGADADLPGDPNCRPELPAGRDIFQVTFTGSSLTKFGIPSGYEGTSMATPHVAATAALIIASGVLGAHPTPAQLTARLQDTATKLGGGGDERLYGAGLVNATAATTTGGPGALAQ
jgi:serine protease